MVYQGKSNFTVLDDLPSPLPDVSIYMFSRFYCKNCCVEMKVNLRITDERTLGQGPCRPGLMSSAAPQQAVKPVFTQLWEAGTATLCTEASGRNVVPFF